MTDASKPAVPADILIIEDDVSMRELLSLHLEIAGYRVRVAEDAVEGGKMLLAGTPPDLLLLDMRMPHMGGDQFLELLRGDEKLKGLKVIALTSIRNEVFIMKVTGMGVSDFLQKPVDKELLLESVRKVLAK